MTTTKRKQSGFWSSITKQTKTKSSFSRRSAKTWPWQEGLSNSSQSSPSIKTTWMIEPGSISCKRINSWRNTTKKYSGLASSSERCRASAVRISLEFKRKNKTTICCLKSSTNWLIMLLLVRVFPKRIRSPKTVKNQAMSRALFLSRLRIWSRKIRNSGRWRASISPWTFYCKRKSTEFWRITKRSLFRTSVRTH